jgi:esterase/lipase superfamily enzyme
MDGRHVLVESKTMGRKMHLWCFGHFGAPLVVFPSAAGFAHEWNAQGMVDALSPLLHSGRIKLYCPESNVAEAWTRKEQPLAYRMDRHAAYEAFVRESLVPFVRDDCRQDGIPLCAVGTSLGGMYAALFALKFPDVFTRAVCMSGRYLATALTKGEDSAALYFNNPLAFVANLDGPHLDRVRGNTHLTLVCGRGAYEEGCIEETIALGKLLDRKDIPNTTDIWGRDSRHDWAWWRKQALLHLTQLFGR